jgi:hypothetical protein
MDKLFSDYRVNWSLAAFIILAFFGWMGWFYSHLPPTVTAPTDNLTQEQVGIRERLFQWNEANFTLVHDVRPGHGPHVIRLRDGKVVTGDEAGLARNGEPQLTTWQRDLLVDNQVAQRTYICWQTPQTSYGALRYELWVILISSLIGICFPGIIKVWDMFSDRYPDTDFSDWGHTWPIMLLGAGAGFFFSLIGTLESADPALRLGSVIFMIWAPLSALACHLIRR